MEKNELSTRVPGRYYWELLFDYDLTDKPGSEISGEETFKIKKKVNYKEFLSNTLNINTGYKYGNESSVGLKFEGIGDVSTKTNYSFHIDLANELVTRHEKDETIEEEKEITRSYKIPPGGKLSMYRLCFDSGKNGMLQKTDITSTDPKDDIFIELNFSCTNHILGLSQILNQFLETRPNSSNKPEWKMIRNSIVKASDMKEEDAFRQFVETLQTIHPTRDNKPEWAEIRTTCGEILEKWDTTDKQNLLKKLLLRFKDTVPTRDNKPEWLKIRTLSSEIASGLQSTTW